MTIAYGACLIVSAAVFVYMAQRNYSSIDTNYWMIVILVPIVILGYWLKTQIESTETAAVLLCFIYLDSTFLITTALFAMMHTLGFETKPWMKLVVYSIACVHVAIVCEGVHSTLYYDSITIIPTALGSATKMTSGPLKLFHYAFLAGLAVWFLGLIIASLLKKKTYSIRSFTLYAVIIGTGLLVSVSEGIIDVDFTILPFLYVIGDVAIALNYDYAHTHDITYVISSQQKHFGARGYIALNPERKFQSCNGKAIEFMPFIKDQREDERIQPGNEHADLLLELVTTCEEEGFASAYFQTDGMDCACEVRPYSLKNNGVPEGYLADIRDATEELKNYRIVSVYNETLNAEVEEKTNGIREMQRKIVLGMANMIENRDNNTGGHVKRTSDIIRILVDEVVAQGTFQISEQMAEDIVRAAPTHDLGKVTIDEDILNKPGEYTDEEYAIMKTHAAKSGELVLILLEGVEEERFVKVAFNVARFHHERWDGSGYPEGRVGTMIPLEARIMAVADVYDALMSKRVYKEAMSFEKTSGIMVAGMGTQFDPRMKAVFLGCREQLEDYYRQHA